MVNEKIKAEIRNLNFYYGSVKALKDINLNIAEKKVTALIGPSGCGKTTYLRCFNRMHDLYPNNRYEGEIILHPDGLNITGLDIDPIEVRMRISMVFQRPNPFPKSIYENVAYGPPDPKQIIFGPPYASARLESLGWYLKEKGYENPTIKTELREEDLEKAQERLDRGDKYFPLSI